ncbi:tail fiber protein [Kordiimonas sp. SCSIO 12603]|uniref:phage tail protein n=1 Tax=Kordiimonas sp. SCSIO 12603 TaxID=2829596 RepID=UPI0021056302|nr:tail fiber protein [Kordiimonas sp. SCSIO 12603]UTW59414.1 tail fiber protein [Kordiimonas sp. SCSIO 12603]
MEAFMGTILAFGFNYAPRDWAMCQGQLAAIANQTALYSLLGTIYGGDGRTTFAYPELRGRSGVSFGQQPGFNLYVQGQLQGATNIHLSQAQMPQHTHTHSYNGSAGGDVTLEGSLSVAETHGTKQIPDAGDYIAAPSNSFGSALEGKLYVTPAEAASVGTVPVGGLALSASGGGSFDNASFTINQTGSSSDINIQNPVTVLNYCIAIEGIYPPRS